MLIIQCDPDLGCGHFYEGTLNTCPKCGGATAILGGLPQCDPSFIVWDIETFPNFTSYLFYSPSRDAVWTFEISERKNELIELRKFSHQLIHTQAKMVGFNSVNFDYPVVHKILITPGDITYQAIYAKAMEIINNKAQFNNHIIWDNEQLIPQIDLFKIHHYDNKAKSTSLKALEFFMRMKNISESPIPFGSVLTYPQMDEILQYNKDDVVATGLFLLNHSLEQIEFRETLSNRYGINFTNASDAKIGSEIFIKQLNDVGIQTHTRNPKAPIQTIHKSVSLKECIPDYINFERPEFNEVLQRFKSTTLYGDNVKALFSGFTTIVDDLEYVYGAGGAHASLQGMFAADEEYCLLDLDVEAYYPSLIIAGNYYPHHLGKEFSPMFRGLIKERIKIGKKTLLGTAIKLILNSTYGNMGNKYSPMYDLKCLLSVTLTGQLALTMLIEKMLLISDCKVLYVNTDGFTVKVKRIHLDYIKTLVTWWENHTSLKMEYGYYSRLFLENTNNYIAEYE